MSRIRNTLRFQTPEERVLNGLLALVVIVLLTVAIAKVRDDRVEAASEVRGVTITRPTLPETGGRDHATTTTLSPTSTTVSPAELFALALAVQRAQRPARSATTTTTVARKGSTSPVAPPANPPPTTGATTPTTHPTTPPTTSTTSTSTTSTSTTTTTTTPPPLAGG